MKRRAFIVIASLFVLGALRQYCGESPLPSSARTDKSLWDDAGSRIGVKGRVRDRGLPVAGAVVSVVAAIGNGDAGSWVCPPQKECVPECAPWWKPEEGSQLGSSVTARDGRFSLTVPPDAGALLWVARTETGAGLIEHVDDGMEIEVDLDKGIVIAGTVWLDGVRPPNGVVAVRAVHREFGASFDGTVSDGRLSVGPLPVGAYALIAKADGYPPALQIVTPESPRAVLHLLATCSIRGTVVQRALPAADAAVLIARDRCVYRTTSGKDGEFGFAEILPGPYTVMARAGSGPAGAVQVIEVPIGCKNESLRLSLDEPSLISGRAIDESGRPIGSVDVAIGEGETGASFRTTSDGRFVLHGWWRGQAVLSAKASGYLEFTRTIDIDGTRTSQDLEMRLERSHRIDGIVTDERGAPVPSAAISARDVANVRPQYSTSSDSNGRFSIGWLPAGRYELTVTHNHFATSLSVAAAPGPEVRVHLGIGESIVGVVSAATGAPSPGASIRVSAEHRAETHWAEADAKGEFSVTGLTPGPYLLTASGRDGEGTLNVVVPLPAGRRASVVLSPVASLFGVARDVAGSAVPYARVSAANASGEIWTERTDKEGRFSFTGLPLGSYRLSALTPDRRTLDDVSVVTGRIDHDVELVLVDLGRLTGRIVDRTGRPVQRFSVNSQEFAESNGRFDISSLTVAERGVRTLRVVANGYFPLEMVVVVAPGESRDVGDITVGVGRELHLRVVSETQRKPIGGAQVWADFPTVTNDVHDPLASTADDGFAHLVGLPLRKARLWVHHPLSGTHRFDVPDDARELTVVLGNRAHLEVRAVDSEARPQAAKIVCANSAEPDQVIVLNTDHKGRIVLDSISAGTWVIVGRSFQPPRRGSALVTIAEGGSSEVELKLHAATREVAMEVAAPTGWVVHEVLVLPKGAALSDTGEPDQALGFVGGWPATYVSPGIFRVEGAIPGKFVAIVTGGDGAWWQAPLSISEEERQRVVLPRPLPDAIHKR